MKTDVDKMLDDLEKYLKEGWSFTLSCRKSGMNYKMMMYFKHNPRYNKLKNEYYLDRNVIKKLRDSVVNENIEFCYKSLDKLDSKIKLHEFLTKDRSEFTLPIGHGN